MNSTPATQILLTRPAERDAALAELLTQQGFQVCCCPLTNFEFYEHEPEVQAAVIALRAGTYDWLVLTSATGVDALNRAFDAAGRDMAAVLAASGLRVAVVGRATGKAAADRGLAVALEPPGPAYSAAELLHVWPDWCATEPPQPAEPAESAGFINSPETAEPSEPGGRRILLARSGAASDELPCGFTALGYRVDDVATYRPVRTPVPGSLATAVAQGDFAAVVLTSGSAAQAYAALNAPTAAPIVAIGRPTAQAASNCGFTGIHIAKATTPEALADAVAAVVMHGGGITRSSAPENSAANNV